MRIAALVVIGLLGALHAYIAWFEIFAWETRGPQVFTSFPAELFSQTVPMAANQGLYNAFLAVGLFWSLMIADRAWQTRVATCFLLFVATAGLFGAITVTPRILVVQFIPAAIGLILLTLSRRTP